jgi:hypothetical protein
MSRARLRLDAALPTDADERRRQMLTNEMSSPATSSRPSARIGIHLAIKKTATRQAHRLPQTMALIRLAGFPTTSLKFPSLEDS